MYSYVLFCVLEPVLAPRAAHQYGFPSPYEPPKGPPPPPPPSTVPTFDSPSRLFVTQYIQTQPSTRSRPWFPPPFSSPLFAFSPVACSNAIALDPCPPQMRLAKKP